ncbi:MAG TPA: POTRA domain-containing protein, partial [Armatimonadota bacterium]|nr:POTRA domain-containing protein [Armatimonadota bacterium]
MIAAPKNCRVGLIAILGVAFLFASQPGWSQANSIEDIKVEGARFVSADGVLAKITETLRVGDAFDPDSNEDRARLDAARRAVLALGFFERVTPAVVRGDDGVTITFSVVEKMRIQRIVFVGNTVFTDDELLEEIVSRSGQIVDANVFRRDADLIKAFYESRGRACNVEISGPDRFGVVTYVINEWVIEDVLIEGLKKTSPKFVNKEITVGPGDVFDINTIQKNALAIQNLDLWEGSVQVTYRQGVKDVERGVIVVFVVKEKRTGTATAGLGYSSLDNVVGVVSASETNFRGRGERITGSVQFGGRQSYELSFFEPMVDKHGTTFEVSLFDTERRRQFLPGGSFGTTNREFDERRKGFNVTLGRPLGDNMQVSLRIRREDISDPLFQVSRVLAPGQGAVGTLQTLPPGFGGNDDELPVPPPNPGLLPDEPEPGDTSLPLTVFAPLADENLSTVTLGITNDTRDLIQEPRRGWFTSFYVEQAGLLGGDSDFAKVSIDTRRYIQVGDTDHVIAVRFLGGTTIGDI